MKAQLNQSNAMFAYDGDYSFLHKEESDSAPENNPSYSLMWLKIAGYKQKKTDHSKSIAHHNLLWLKIDGYKNSGNESRMEALKIKMYSTEIFYESVYERIKLQKTKHQFYLSTMTMLILLNLVFFLSVFNH